MSDERYYKDLYLKTKEKRKAYALKRKEKLKTLTVELSPLAAHALHVLAIEEGLSKAKLLTRMLEVKAERRGIVLPEPVSQVVTTKETPKVDLTKTLDVWEEE